jgi:uncharacterized tellurite resistance protein B-like protein
MNKLLARKINLLLHLAKVDGHFDLAEKMLLLSILKEGGLEESYLDQHSQENVDLIGLRDVGNKEELLFWVLKLIHADGLLHPSELAYAKIVARQLNFREDVIIFFQERSIPSLLEFEKIAKGFIIRND